MTCVMAWREPIAALCSSGGEGGSLPKSFGLNGEKPFNAGQVLRSAGCHLRFWMSSLKIVVSDRRVISLDTIIASAIGSPLGRAKSCPFNSCSMRRATFPLGCTDPSSWPNFLSGRSRQLPCRPCRYDSSYPGLWLLWTLSVGTWRGKVKGVPRWW